MGLTVPSCSKLNSESVVNSISVDDSGIEVSLTAAAGDGLLLRGCALRRLTRAAAVLHRGSGTIQWEGGHYIAIDEAAGCIGAAQNLCQRGRDLNLVN